MARIELRHCNITIKDGLAGTAAVNQMAMPPMANDTSLTIDTVALNTDLTQKVPVGARFTIAGETLATQVHVVLTRTNSMDVTTAITFSGKTTSSSASAVKLRSIFDDVRCAMTEVKQEVQPA